MKLSLFGLLLFWRGYVGILPNGRVWGQNGAIISPDNRLIWDVSLEWVKNQKDHSIFKVKELTPISQTFDTVADLTHVGSRNYFHWMYEVFPRLHLLEWAGMKPDTFIVKQDHEYLPFQDETLSKLGIKREQVMKTHPDFHIEARKLIVPSQPSFVTKWAFTYLRSVFLENCQHKMIGNHRLYISRKRTRKIVNEPELIKLLASFGFIRIELENLSVAEQIELFSNAETIISSHGAGLTNSTFCRPGTKVLEIFSTKLYAK
ncbi:MAG: glycosyltransferase family 61 protein [Bacillota bacterium]|nr:glycosyltransferase family 61 protein [Bacillota bacterium]